MLRFYINDGTGERDYTRYIVDQSTSIQKSLNVPSICSLSLCNYDGGFIMPAQRSYIRIYSEKYQRSLFTGFLTNDPTRSFLGMGRSTNNGGQLYTFQCTFTSDEYLLNIKSVNFIPAFVNQPQGFILRTIAETLCPGFFDFTYCASGDIVPFLQYDPTQSWSEIAKTFCDPSRYRYSAIDKQIHFQPYGDGHLGVVYDEDMKQGDFDPFSLTTSATTTPIVNDVTIIGQQEAGNNHEDFFIGDGFTGAFPLRHKVFGLADSQQGGSILLSDSWNETQINTQNWVEQDPAQNFNFGVANTQALNVITGQPNSPGVSFIVANNALELAGGLVLQHGELVFNDSSTGIIGGIFDSEVLNGFGDVSLDETKCESGFQVTPTQNVVVTASGAAGILLQPTRLGQIPEKAFQVETKVNCSYVLTTTISAPAASRYNQVFRTMAGVVFGSAANATTMLGNITWSIVETNLFTGVQTTYTYTLANQELPQTAIYALLDNQRLNITLTTTYITAPIPGSLNVTCKVGAGLLAPIYVSGNVQYTGAFVTPSGGNLPIYPQDFGPENNFALGTSLQNQAAELDSGQVTDTLNFYSDDLPGVGVRIRLQTWESQAAVSRVQDPTSIQQEAAVVGDDGLRSAIVSNLTPLPRTSEDCDYAAQAFLWDRIGSFYQGSYNASSLLFFRQPDTNDIEFYPTCGRYLYINAPRRNIIKQNFIVTSLTTTVVDLSNEIMNHNISFGPDLFLDKLLAALVPQPTNVLTPIDTTVQPPPQALLTIGTNYLPDVMQTTVSTPISGARFLMSLNDAVPFGANYEIRDADLNWGMADNSTLIATVPSSGNIFLDRSAYDQTWFIRLVKKINGQIISSRRSKVIRIFYPRVPTQPAYIRADSSEIFVDFSGDVRNIEGIELRGPDDVTTYYQAIVGSEFDMDLQLNTLRGQLSPGQAGTGPIGQFQIAEVPPTLRSFVVHFFNLMWEYSPGLTITIPPPAAPTLLPGYRFGSALNLILKANDPVPRNDIAFSTLQLAVDTGFSDSSVFQVLQTVGNPGFFTTTVPTTGDIFARATMTDQISSGGWSNILHITQQDLIASDYLASQGSVPPAVTNANTTSGGIFTYGVSNEPLQIVMQNAVFFITYPNGFQDFVESFENDYLSAIDSPGGLLPLTTYGFFPSLKGPTTSSPGISFNGPYLNYLDSSVIAEIAAQFSDGNVPLTNGAFVVTTPAAGSESGGGGGGTQGGGNCGEISRLILCADGTRKQLKDIKPGQRVQNLAGRVSVVKTMVMFTEETVIYKTESGLETETALGHVLFVDDKWQSLHDIIDNPTHRIACLTEKNEKDYFVELILGSEQRWICKISLEPSDKDKATDDDHIYNLDGFWTHNFLIKNNGGPIAGS